jgi:hypothetical protein
LKVESDFKLARSQLSTFNFPFSTKKKSQPLSWSGHLLFSTNRCLQTKQIPTALAVFKIIVLKKWRKCHRSVVYYGAKVEKKFIFFVKKIIFYANW